MAARPGIGHAFIALHGDLGAGKTTFVRHLLRALGVTGRVKSPTYALMEPYELPALGDAAPGWHFDFYRFDDAQEWEDAGFRDIFASAGLKLAEWPDKAAGLLPVADLRIDIAIAIDAGDAAGSIDARASNSAGADDSDNERDSSLGDRGDDASTAYPRNVTFTAATALGSGLLPS